MSDFNDKIIKVPGFGYIGSDIDAIEIPERYKIEDIDANELALTTPIIRYFINVAYDKNPELSNQRSEKLILLCHQFIVENTSWIKENNISIEQIALAFIFSYLSLAHLVPHAGSRKFVEKYFKVFHKTISIGTFTVDRIDGTPIDTRTPIFNEFSENFDKCILKISEYDSDPDPGSNFSLLLTKIKGGRNKNKKLILKGTKRMKRNMKTRKSRKIRNKKTQRMYLQKGCAKLKLSSRRRRGHSVRCKCKRCKICGLQNGGCGCGIGLPQLGGCGCGLKGGGGVPAPLVGSPWTPQVSGWPGVAGLPGQTNYLSLNEYKGGDPQTQGIQFNKDTMSPTKGGGRGRGRGRGKKGGSGTLIPQDLVNLGRTLTYGLGSAYNNINGYAQPVSPLPFQDQLRNVAYIK